MFEFEYDPEYDDLIPDPQAYRTLQEELNAGLRPVQGTKLPRDKVDLTYTRRQKLKEYLLHVELRAATKPIPPIPKTTRAAYSPGWESRRLETKSDFWISGKRLTWIRSLILEILSTAEEPMPLLEISYQINRKSYGEIANGASLCEKVLPRVLAFLEIEGLIGRCWSRYKANKFCYYLEDDFEEEDEISGGLRLAIGDQLIEFKGRTNHDLVTVVDFRPHPNRPEVVVPVVQGKKLGIHYSSKDLLSRPDLS